MRMTKRRISIIMVMRHTTINAVVIMFKIIINLLTIKKPLHEKVDKTTGTQKTKGQGQKRETIQRNVEKLFTLSIMSS